MVTICESRQGCCLTQVATTAQLPGGIPILRIIPSFSGLNQDDRYHVSMRQLVDEFHLTGLVELSQA